MLSLLSKNRLFFDRSDSIICQHQRKVRCLFVRDHPTGPRHAQLLCALTAVLKRTTMRVKRPSIRLMATLTIFTAILFVTSTWAAAEEKVLRNFNADGIDGENPYAGLIFDAAGNLYGTTSDGGTSNSGTLFELTPAAGGTWTEKVLHSFSGGADGTHPYAGLIFDAAGNLYGTTDLGGAYGYGTVFELTPGAGGTWTEKVLHNFNNGTDGQISYGGLIFDAAGNLYGPTRSEERRV